MKDMPMMPPRRCPSCNALVTGRCLTCVTQHDHRRENASARGYCSVRWRKLRLLKLSLDPLCSACTAQGKTVVATDVDHLQRHDGPDDPKFWAWTNLDSKCHACHSRKTALFDSSFVSRDR